MRDVDEILLDVSEKLLNWCLKCFETVVWVAGRSSGLLKTEC